MAIHVLQNSIHALRVLLKCVTIRCFTSATRKRFIIFIMTFACINLKIRIIQSSFHCINLCFYCRLFWKHYKDGALYRIFFQILLFVANKVRGKKKLVTCQCFRWKTVYFTEHNVLLKQPIRIEYLIKQKSRGTFAGKQERMRRGR